MAEEFRGRICGGSWWNSSKSAFMGGSPPCAFAGTTDVGFGPYVVDLKSRSCNVDSVSENSMIFQNSQKPQQQANSESGGSTILMDSTLQMVGFGLPSSSSSSDWSQTLALGNGRADNGYNSMAQQEDVNTGLNSSLMQKDWSPKSFTSTSDDSSVNAFKAINQDFCLEQQRLNPVNSSANSTTTCQGLSSTGLLVGSSSASYGYPSSLIQSLFEPGAPPPQQLFDNQSMNYANYGSNLNELAPSWTKISPFMKPSLPKQEYSHGLQVSSNTPFWNASTTSIADIGATLIASSNPQFLMPTLEDNPNCPNVSVKVNNEAVRDSGSVVKKGSEPAFKRPRIEAPTPLPTFKVRKEKLGDRITALQQLVSPFGKTDTASVLHEAIEYIKFLHDQVSVLSTPYMKNSEAIQHQQVVENNMDSKGIKQDLRSRGLCLVPISSTFPVPHETTTDFWTPSFGATFR
ncbi:hypothetical protein K2173_004418 [Erythroxylum novogranatense]|uniref:BHLH domain-containing protein n=1 Tax=Erythroxylum novogranatense TaxID=1862640 RepID=A0AAV8T4N1_9ROSI|nr:hypothetical protein K2173_004418 [Erythroxylum novogranatense]